MGERAGMSFVTQWASVRECPLKGASNAARQANLELRAERLLQGICTCHPDDDPGEVALGVDIEEIAVVHVVLRPVL